MDQCEMCMYYGYDEEYEEEVVEDEEGEYEEEVLEEDVEYGEDSGKPDRLLTVRAAGSGLPRKLPADSVFSVSAAIEGAVYPNYAFFMQGSTHKNGAFTASLCKPGTAEKAPVEIFRIDGTVVPADRKDAPDFRKKSVKEAYNIFSLNEQSLAEFTGKMIPLAVRGLLSFVAEAPTSACQALLDDLTDLGVLGMLMN